MGRLTHSPGVQEVESSVGFKVNLSFVSRNPFICVLKDELCCSSVISDHDIISLLVDEFLLLRCRNRGGCGQAEAQKGNFLKSVGGGLSIKSSEKSIFFFYCRHHVREGGCCQWCYHFLCVSSFMQVRN